MCVCPRTIERRIAGRVRLDVVPCGKCHECLAKSQNEFAALACLEAKRRSSMWFFTFTYSNNTCPICGSSSFDGCDRTRWFVQEPDRSEICSTLALNMDGSKKLHPVVIDGIDYCPSLCREDWRLFIKRTRLAYEREFGSISKFVYAGFGEYGGQFNRPHGHFLFYDLTDQEARYFQMRWNTEFGFCSLDKIPVVNRDGSPAHVKVSKYVAKYLHKPKTDFQPLLDGLCEAPRRVSSRGFGVGVVEDKLKDFYLANDLKNQPLDVRFNEILERRKSLIIDGSKFPLPRRISDKFFREESYPKIDVHINEQTGEITERRIRQTRRTALSIQVSRFARDRYLQEFIDKLRKNSESISDVSFYSSIKKVLDDEAHSLEDRAKYARKLYLQYLKKQKYG